MLPLLILVVPPTILGGGYSCWYLGQQTALLSLPSTSTEGKKRLASQKMKQTTTSYITGMITFASVYSLQSMLLFPTTNVTPVKKPSVYETNIRNNTTIAAHNNSNINDKNNNSNNNQSNKQKYIPPHKRKAKDQFQPPKTFNEAFQRMGRPVLIRSGCAGVAFFVAGLAQTFMVVNWDIRK